MNYKDFISIREEHYVEHLGELTQKVMHSTDQKFPHVDIYQFEPTEERPYWTLITGGMSNERMHIPEESFGEIGSRAEICMYVKEPKGWMFSVLKGLAEMPFDDKTFLHWWHTVPNGMPMTAEKSLLTNYLFLLPYFEQETFDTLEINEDRVDLLWMVPITDAELEYKVANGAEALEKVFEEKGMDLPVIEQRESYV
ncbi:MAG: suppressor of fused domain protein [Planctomycetota bacterium]|jgi:hypothetical protein